MWIRPILIDGKPGFLFPDNFIVRKWRGRFELRGFFRCYGGGRWYWLTPDQVTFLD